MIEYKNGNFSQFQDSNEMLEMFKKQADVIGKKAVKSLHFGSLNEIEQIKEDTKLLKRLENLETKVNDLTPAKSFLEIPTSKDIEIYS
jgi:hypothetical protein